MTLQEQLAALREVRARGVRTVEVDGRRVVYATDAELAAAILDLERRIAAEGATAVKAVRIVPSKGLT